MERRGGKPGRPLRAFLLVVPLLVVYGRTVGFDFVNYDDPTYVTENPEVLAGLSASGLRWALTTDHAGNWHPVTWLSHMLDVALFGQAPGGHHATSVLLHAATALLLLRFLATTTGRPWASFLAAALFAWHPLRVESVAWIAERKEVLAGFFWMLTLTAWTRYARRPASGNYLLALALFALGLAAKPILVTLPLVLLLVDVWPLRRLSRAGGPIPRSSPARLVLEKVPFLFLSAASCAITMVVQHRGGSVAKLGALDLALRAQNALASTGTYLRQTLWPSGLACFYPHAGLVEANPHAALLAPALAGGTALVALTALVWRARRPDLRVGWLWTLGALVPVIGLVQVGAQAHADRYTYLPMIGVAIAASFAAADAARARPDRRLTIGAVATVLLLALLVATWRQVGTWRDSVTLWRRALAVTHSNWLAHENLGQAWLERGEVERAIPELEAAVRIQPRDLPALLNLGFAHLKLGELEEARAPLERAARLAPDDRRVHSNLGLRALRAGELDEAAAAYRRALALAPQHAGDRVQLAKVCERAGDRRAAVAHYRRALATGAAPRAAAERLAWILATAPDPALRAPDEAQRLARQALAAAPESAAALEALAAALAAGGHHVRAAERQREALARLPENERAAARQRLALYENGAAFVESP